MIVALSAAHLGAPAPEQLALPFPARGDTPRPVPVTCDICGTRETQRLRFGEPHRACSRCTLASTRSAHAGPTVALRGPGLQVLGEVPGERRGREVIPHEDRFSDQDRAVWDAYCRLHDEAEARMELGAGGGLDVWHVEHRRTPQPAGVPRRRFAVATPECACRWGSVKAGDGDATIRLTYSPCERHRDNPPRGPEERKRRPAAGGGA